MTPPKREGLRARVAAGFARVEEPAAAVWPWPIAGFLAGAWAALMSLLTLCVVVVLAWIFAPLGDGGFGDALHAGGGAWLLANGGAMQWQGAWISLPPLAVTFGLLLFQRRAGRWLVIAIAVERAAHALPPIVFAAAASASVQVLVAATIAGDELDTPLLRNAAGAFVVAILGFAWGANRELAPQWSPHVVIVVRALRLYASTLILSACGLTFALIVVQRDAFLQVLDAIAGDFASTMQVLLLCLAFLPTFVLWMTSALLGAPFTIGVGTHVSLGGMTLGALPPIPLLALLPNAMPADAQWLLVVPVVAAALTVVRIRGDRTLMARLSLVMGAGLLGAAGGFAASGGFGPGRLEWFGASWWRMGVASAAWLIGVLLLDEVWQRVRATRAEPLKSQAE